MSAFFSVKNWFATSVAGFGARFGRFGFFFLFFERTLASFFFFLALAFFAMLTTFFVDIVTIVVNEVFVVETEEVTDGSLGGVGGARATRSHDLVESLVLEQDIHERNFSEFVAEFFALGIAFFLISLFLFGVGVLNLFVTRTIPVRKFGDWAVFGGETFEKFRRNTLDWVGYVFGVS